MRGEGYVVNCGHVGDLSAFGQTAAPGDVGHDDVDRLLLQQIPVAGGIDVHIDLQNREAAFRHIIRYLFDFVEIHARRDMIISS